MSKRPRTFSRAEKEIVSANGYNWKDWLFLKDWGAGLHIVNKATGKEITITKYPPKPRKR